MQAVLDMLGGSFDGIVDANLLPWAQLAWGAGGVPAGTAVAATLVQRLDWQEMAFTLPGPLSLADWPCLYLKDHNLQNIMTVSITTMLLPGLHFLCDTSTKNTTSHCLLPWNTQSVHLMLTANTTQSMTCANAAHTLLC